MFRLKLFAQIEFYLLSAHSNILLNTLNSKKDEEVSLLLMDKERESEIKIHQGENVKRIISLFNISQDFVADKLGVSQQTLSLIEQKEIIDPTKWMVAIQKACYCK